MVRFFKQVRAQKKPYQINVEKNDLNRLKTTTDQRVLGDEKLWPQKAREAPLLGIRAIVKSS